MKKIILITALFFLIVSTSLTKNSTKRIENKIYNTEENLRVLNNKYEMVLLEFNYLSSPKKLLEYQYKYFEKELGAINIIDVKKIYIQNNELIVENYSNDRKEND
jgi:hypothetical protein